MKEVCEYASQGKSSDNLNQIMTLFIVAGEKCAEGDATESGGDEFPVASVRGGIFVLCVEGDADEHHTDGGAMSGGESGFSPDGSTAVQEGAITCAFRSWNPPGGEMGRNPGGDRFGE